MNMERPHFDNTYNFGHVLQGTILIFTVVGVIWAQAIWQGNVDNKIETIKGAVGQLQNTVLPLVQGNANLNKLQDDRIENLRRSMDDISRTNGAILTAISTVREDVSALKAENRVLERGAPK